MTGSLSKAAWCVAILLVLAGCAAEQRGAEQPRGEVEAPAPAFPGLKVEMVGVVLDSNGVPVGRCRVEVRDRRGETVYTTRTAANGRYGIPWIPIGGALSVVITPESCGAVVRRYGSPDAFVRSPPVEVRVPCGGTHR